MFDANKKKNYGTPVAMPAIVVAVPHLLPQFKTLFDISYPNSSPLEKSWWLDGLRSLW